MAFPAHPSKIENEPHFLIQDPFGLGRSILPIWDLQNAGNTLLGLGSAFRVDPFGQMYTAYHVLEHTLIFNREGNLRPDPADGSNPLILEIGGMAIGRCGIKNENWLPIQNFLTRVKPQVDPFTQIEPQNEIELIKLLVPSKLFGPSDHSFLQCSDRRVAIGEKLLAIGYSGMNVQQPTDIESAFEISAYQYGSIRTVIEVHGSNSHPSRPWPKYVVDGDWPAGMSGGPVFDQNGMVVGIVSTGSPAGNYATARAFWGDGILQYCSNA